MMETDDVEGNPRARSHATYYSMSKGSNSCYGSTSYEMERVGRGGSGQRENHILAN